MTLTLRDGRLEDAEVAGPICYEAFKTINEAHGFPPDLPTPEVGTWVLGSMLRNPGFYVVVAEDAGRVIGSNAVDLRSEIAGIGPITVDPKVQNKGAGRALMAAVLERASRHDGVRLVQAAFHNRSLSLYTKLGFDPVEPLSCVSGTPLARALPGTRVRTATEADLADCDAVCRRVHGHARSGEVAESIRAGQTSVVERRDSPPGHPTWRITGYCTGIAFFSHAVGESNDDVMALIAAAPAFHGPGFLVPTRNAKLLRWCLEQGLRIVQPMTLMKKGRYEEPRGAYLASISY